MMDYNQCKAIVNRAERAVSNQAWYVSKLREVIKELAARKARPAALLRERAERALQRLLEASTYAKALSFEIQQRANMTYEDKVIAKLTLWAQEDGDMGLACQEMLQVDLKEGPYFTGPKQKGYNVLHCAMDIAFCADVWDEDYAIKRREHLANKYRT